MISINEKSLIIEIPCTKNETPLSLLSDLQTGLINFISIIDHETAPKKTVEWALHNLERLLTNMMMNDVQMGEINSVPEVKQILK